MSRQVFISYSSKDVTGAQKVCEAIESAGYTCWIAPRDVTPGWDYAEEIVNAIEGCAVMVLVLSVNSNMSAHIKREVEQSTSQNKAMIPFFIETVDLSKNLRYHISIHHWLMAVDPPLEQHFGKLVDTIGKIISNGPNENPGSPKANPTLVWTTYGTEGSDTSGKTEPGQDEYLAQWSGGSAGEDLGEALFRAMVLKAAKETATDINFDRTSSGVR